MKNRAKCKLCQSIIESFHREDYVECSCGEISVHGGTDHYGVSYRDASNFLRVDDEENEIVIKVKDKENEDVKQLDNDIKPSKEDLIKMLDEMANNIEALPSYAKQTPVTQYDLLSLVSLISLILKTK